MIKLNEFLGFVEKGQVPVGPPEPLSFSEYYKVDPRRTCIEYGMWPIVDKIWTGQLAGWIGQRKVLEIMAGAGWIAKALSEYGVDIVATDDYSWDNHTHKKMKRVHPVKKLNASKAIKTFQADILLCSWPPYNESSMYRAMKLWGKDRPIIYIGESYGGCNATDEFFQEFETVDHPHFSLHQWQGIHDYVSIGYWKDCS